MNLIADAMRDGGLFMWPILLVAVVGSSVALERLFYVFHRAGINARVFMTEVQRTVLDGNLDQAVRLCDVDPDAALSRLVKVGLVRAGRPESELRDALEEERLALVPLIRRRVAYLPMLATVAVLLGLLGTIHGLMLTLHPGPDAAPPLGLADGAGMALYSTFFGLLVAVPLVVAHGLIVVRANALVDELDHHVLRLVNLLNARRQRGGSQGGGAPVLPFPG